MQPIYRSDGEWVAVFDRGNIFNVDGEWIGFVEGRTAYNTIGNYLGYLSNDHRLLRHRSDRKKLEHKTPPARPKRPSIPSTMPLAPMLRALPFGIIDLFEESPEKLMFISETRPDME